MRTSKSLFRDARGAALLGALLTVAGTTGARAQSPTLAISPAVITNNYQGRISLTIGSLAPGKKVIVQKYADLNNNGVVDLGQDWLVQSFEVTDGVLPRIGGVRNLNVPGDDDGATNAQIRVDLNFPGMNAVLDRIAGRYLYRVVDPLGVFTPTVSPLLILQKSWPQAAQGTAWGASGAILSNTVVVMLTPQGNDGGGAFSDAAGNFSISNAPGDYALVALRPGFVSDMGAAQVSVASNNLVTRNLTNQVATRTIAGKVTDSSTLAGLPALFVQAETQDNLFVLNFCDTNGDYVLPVTTNQWKVKLSPESGLASGGYVGTANKITTNTFSGSVSNLNFQVTKGNALVYGRMTDTLSNAIASFTIQANDSSYVYESGGRTTTNGDYSVAVFAGDWQVSPSSDDLAIQGLLGQGISVSLTNGQALLRDLSVQRPTAHLRGRVVTSLGAPVDNMMLVISMVSTSGPSQFQVNPQTAGDGTFDAGVFAGTWGLALECGSASQRGLVSPNLTVNVVNGVDQTNLVLIAQVATAQITGTIQDNLGNPVTANLYASLFLNGTNYNACSGGESSSFTLAVFPGTWQLGVSGDLVSRGYDNPQYRTLAVANPGTNVVVTGYPLGKTPITLGGGSYNNGQFQFWVSGAPEGTYRVEMTTNLNNPASWTPVRTNTAFGGTFSFIDTNAPASPPRFYRARPAF
jgi:hypothetical protein